MGHLERSHGKTFLSKVEHKLAFFFFFSEERDDYLTKEHSGLKE